MKVVFLYHPKNDDLYAVFLEDTNGSFLGGYSHIGQHSDVHVDYMKESRIAKKEEYKELLKELEYIGYDDLEVRNEINTFEL